MTYSGSKLIKGLDKLADIIETTFGPKGSNVMIDGDPPSITNDGLNILKALKLEGTENMAIKFVKDATERQNRLVGDGRKTTILLSRAIVKAGKKSRLSAIELLEQIRKETSWILRNLVKMTRPMNESELSKVAEIACESKEIGDVIAECALELGVDSAITVEESPYFGVSKEIVKGLQIESGYASDYLQTSEGKAEYSDVSVLVVDSKILNADHLASIMKEVHESGKTSMVIFSEGIEGDAMTTVIVNKRYGGFSVLAVNIPGFGDRKKEVYKDICALTNATFISKELGRELKSVKLEDLGHIDKIVSSKTSTVVVGKGDVQSRIDEIKSQLVTASEFDKHILEQRLAGLSGGVAIIHVGAATETEMKYVKQKTEDGICAVKAAMEEGVVPGGGRALIEASKGLPLKILKKAIRVPYELISKQIKDEGSLDPLKVTRMALENASSMAGTFLTATPIDEK
jgi:chaperonin GroEL